MDETFRNPSLPRIMRESTWPKIRLRYELTQNRRVISAGEELLSDHMYLGSLGMASSGDALRYEKNMLDDWFRRKFAAAASSRFGSSLHSRANFRTLAADSPLNPSSRMRSQPALRTYSTRRRNDCRPYFASASARRASTPTRCARYSALA